MSTEQTTALTTVSPAEEALASFGFTEGEPLKPVRLELIQPIQIGEEDGLIAGRFRDSQSNLQYESLNIVPLLMTPGRVCFPPGGDLGAKPICRSSDGKFPVISDDLVRQDGGLGCAKCPKAQWKKVGGKNIKSECTETMSFLFAELETGFIFRFNAKKMALSPVKDLKETIRKIVLMAKAKGQFAPPYGLTFKLTSVKIKGQKGTYFIPKFTPTGQVHPDDVSKFQGYYQFFTSKREEIAASTDPVDQALDGEYVSENTQYEQA